MTDERDDEHDGRDERRGETGDQRVPGRSASRRGRDGGEVPATSAYTARARLTRRAALPSSAMRLGGSAWSVYLLGHFVVIVPVGDERAALELARSALRRARP